MHCEMCGSDTAKPRRIQVDNSVLRVCQACERFGKPIDVSGPGAPPSPGNVREALERRRRLSGSRNVFESDQMNLELVEDYAKRIRTARERKGWTREQLGGRVGERETAIGNIENGSLHPTDDVARRMERELGIKLFEPVQAATTKRSESRSLTLGDLLRDAKRKQEP